MIYIRVDEIESISISRTSLFKGSEPSDSIRAVNVLLTQIDKLREIDNILILATSNLLDTVDAAFLDRVDRKFKLGQPSRQAKYDILASGVTELMLKGIIEEFPLPSLFSISLSLSETQDHGLVNILDEHLRNSSGRSIRKLPFLALTESIQESAIPVPPRVFLASLKRIASMNEEDVYN